MSPLRDWFRHSSVNRTSGMCVTLIAAIVYWLTIPKRHLADNFCITCRYQLLTETFAVNCWLKLSLSTVDWNFRCQLLIETFGVEIWLKRLIETFAVNFWLKLLIEIRCQLLIIARAVEPSLALLNLNCGMLICVECSIRKLLSKLDCFSCLKMVSKEELHCIKCSNRIDFDTN